MRVRRLLPLFVFASLSLATVAHAQALYWIDTNYGAPTLNQTDQFGTPISSVALDVYTQPEGLAVEASGKLYWAEGAWSGARIMRAAPTLAQASLTTMVSGGSTFRGIAVDDVDHYLYWTTSNQITGARIQRSALDGSGETTVLALAPTANPRGIAVDHNGGKLYWADFDQDAIYRANLNGTSLELWQSLPPQSHPWGVAYDPFGQNVYWAEYAGQIRRAATLGGLPTTLVVGAMSPTYLCLDTASQQMYWSEAGDQAICHGPMNGGTRVLLPLSVTSFGGLAFKPNASLSAPGPSLPTAFELAPPAPNPARGDVDVQFALPHDARVRLSVLDLQGREVTVLADGVLPAGRYARSWSDDAPHRAPAGIYFVRFAADGRTWVRRVVRVR